MEKKGWKITAIIFIVLFALLLILYVGLIWYVGDEYNYSSDLDECKNYFYECSDYLDDCIGLVEEQETIMAYQGDLIDSLLTK